MSEENGQPPDEAAYATRIEEVFIEERGTPFLLSAKDWQLIRGWRENGIPVDTVVRAVRETFARRRARGVAGKIASISYCADAVEERWQMERRGLVGKGTEGREEAPVEIGPRLESLVVALRSAGDAGEGGIDREILRKEVGKAASKIDALAREASFEEIEEKLSAIERALVRNLATRLAPAAAASVEASVAEALGETAGVAPEIVERMRRALVRREVRRRVGLPPLTLL